jgi:anti-sigma factor RsiW
MPEWFATDAHPDVETLAAYLDGLLVERERDAVQTHIATCEPCDKLVAEVRQIQLEGVFESVAGIVADASPHPLTTPVSMSGNVLPFARRRALIFAPLT